MMQKKGSILKHLMLILSMFLLWMDGLIAQVEQAPLLLGNRNQISRTGLDFAGNTIGKNRNYFNALGKATQRQGWDVLTAKVWASESIYDKHGRPALQTLSAPIGNQFGYSGTFILDGNNNSYTTADFDQGPAIQNPSIAGSASLLRAYYSTGNIDDPYQDITAYPFSRSVYSQLIPGSVHKSLGGNKIAGEWKQTYHFMMTAGTELASTAAFGPGYNTNTRVVKAITRDVHGIDIVSFTDSDGNVLAAARSGNEEGTNNLHTTTLSIDKQGFVDIHIPKGVSSFTIENPDPDASGDLRVYNLITEQPLPSISGIYATLNVTSGFYRIAVSTPTAYAESESAPITVSHQVNYYDYSLNSYDKAQRLISSKQTLNHLETTFAYNTLGQVLHSNSPEEGLSRFLYRKDGQIRFSQNSQQARPGTFTYTNYDIYGRVIESGLYDGKNAGLSFNAAANIVDQLDDLNDAYCSDVTRTLYDIPDPKLAIRLKECRLPEKYYRQTFTAGNVVKTWTEKPFTTTTWYSYDIHNRVRWIIQDIPELSCLKTIDYSYDPATGETIEIDYQRYEKEERFIHRYTYNRAGQLAKVITSATNGENFSPQAEYFYNEVGELSRTVLAKDLQGIDYLYNINGQLKAINHPSLVIANDPGRDGENGIKPDVFGMSIDYYNGDYARPHTPTPIAEVNTYGINQFNGNIKGIRFKTEAYASDDRFSAYMYQYNKNDWLKTATFGQGNIAPINGGKHQVNFTANSHRDYKVEAITYDENGNLQSLNRNGYTDGEGDNRMDQFNYQYDSTNKLQEIEDVGDNADAHRYNDLKDQSNNDNSNYFYNSIGQLSSDIESQAFYEYNTAGLVTKINTFGKGEGTSYQLYFQNFSTATNAEAATWSVNPGTASINFSGEYFGPGGRACPTLQTRYYRSLKLDMYAGGKATKIYDVIPNVPQTLSLDLIVLQKNYTGYTLSILDENDTVLKSTSFNLNLGYIDDLDLSETACAVFYDQSESLLFTPPSDKIKLQIQVFSNSPESPIYLDNIEIEATIVPKLAFFYNDRGDRVRKESYDGEGYTDKTYYVRDVTGNSLAVYSKRVGPGGIQPLALEEQAFYGAGRLGILHRDNRMREGGLYTYQLSDHLGNIRAVILKDGDNAVAISNKTDYYPFGMSMPGRQVTDGNYRYAYQGQEKDAETGMEAFELRLWDNRIGRWLSTDPYGQYASPYVGMGNNPISRIDPDGGMDCPDPPCGDPEIVALDEVVIHAQNPKLTKLLKQRDELATQLDQLNAALSNAGRLESLTKDLTSNAAIASLTLSIIEKFKAESEEKQKEIVGDPNKLEIKITDFIVRYTAYYNEERQAWGINFNVKDKDALLDDLATGKDVVVLAANLSSKYIKAATETAHKAAQLNYYRLKAKQKKLKQQLEKLDKEIAILEQKERRRRGESEGFGGGFKGGGFSGGGAGGDW